MTSRQEHRKHIQANASKKLRTNLRILSVVYTILFIITLYQLVISQTIFWQVVVAIVIGFVAGLVSARMYKISWDENESEVVGRIDIYGGVVLTLFIIFELNRGFVAGLFASGESVGSLSLVLITAALFGRIFATSKRILFVLRDEKAPVVK